MGATLRVGPGILPGRALALPGKNSTRTDGLCSRCTYPLVAAQSPSGGGFMGAHFAPGDARPGGPFCGVSTRDGPPRGSGVSLAGEDSNLQLPDPKSGVLPLNYPP